MAKELELTPVEERVQAMRKQFQYHRRLSMFASAVAVVMGSVVLILLMQEVLQKSPDPVLTTILQVMLAIFAAISWQFSRFQWQRAEGLFRQLYS